MSDSQIQRLTVWYNQIPALGEWRTSFPEAVQDGIGIPLPVDKTV